MKKKWLRITLTILAGIVLLAAVGFGAYRLGTLSSSRFASVEGPRTIVFSDKKGEFSEGAFAEKFLINGESFPGMKDKMDSFGEFHGMMGVSEFRGPSQAFSTMARGSSHFRSFSPLRCLFSLVLLATLFLLIIFIVKALKKKGRVSLKVVSAPEPEEVDSKKE